MDMYIVIPTITTVVLAILWLCMDSELKDARSSLNNSLSYNDELNKQLKELEVKGVCTYCGKITASIPKNNAKYCGDCEYGISAGHIHPTK